METFFNNSSVGVHLSWEGLESWLSSVTSVHARISQIGAEVFLTAPTLAAARLSQIGVEVFLQGDLNVKAELMQATTEVWEVPASYPARMSQIATEVWAVSSTGHAARMSQIVSEVFLVDSGADTNARLGQLATEVYIKDTSPLAKIAAVTQEVWFGFISPVATWSTKVGMQVTRFQRLLTIDRDEEDMPSRAVMQFNINGSTLGGAPPIGDGYNFVMWMD
jgi:hypothetical protein